MASSPKKGRLEDDKVPSSESVKTMNDSDVSSWINTFIGTSGECTTADSRRNLLQKYLQKQEKGLSTQHLPLSSSVDIMPFDEVCGLILNQIGTFAECKDEQSQRNLLKTYLHTKELTGRRGSRYDTRLVSGYPLDDEVENGSDFVDHSSQMTSLRDGLSPKVTLVDTMPYIEVANWLQKLHIKSTNNLETDRLSLNQCLYGKRRIHSLSQKVKDKLNEAVQRYSDFKNVLLTCCCDLIDVVQNGSFKKEINEPTNLFFPGYETELLSMRTKLKNITDEFEIVVIGETSAGKSTFLNVLLGQDILASHTLHETKCLYRLHNSENRRIEYIVGQNKVSKTMKDSSNVKETLKSITQEIMSRKGDDKSLKTIDVYWPVPSLHENVVLVDTPGIGNNDTPALTKQVVEYIPNAAGYILIVDSSHAGGIDVDVVRQLVETIATSASKEEHIKHFRNTVFVCNKWDLVPEQDREAVLKNTKEQLRRYCGQLENWQIVQFNAVLELQLLEMKANQTVFFDVLLKSMENLMDRTINTRLGNMYRWLRTFSEEVNGLIKVRMVAQSQSKEEVLAKIDKAKEQLKLLTKGLERHTEVSALIDAKEKELLQALKEHLKCPDTKTKLLDWTSSAPKLDDVDKVGPTLIKRRLQDAILDWANAENGPLEEATKTMLDRYKEMKAEAELRFKAIKELELGFTLKDRSEENRSLSMGASLALVITFPFWIIVVLPIWAISRLVRSKQLSIDAMKEMTERAVGQLLQIDEMKTFITNSFTRPQKQCVAKFVEETKRKQKATDDMMSQLRKDLNLTSDTVRQLTLLQIKLNKCSKCLRESKVDI